MNISIAASKITQVILAALICMGCGVSSAPATGSNGASVPIVGQHNLDESDFIKKVRESNMLYYIVWLLFEVQWWGNQTLCTPKQLQTIVTELTAIYNDLLRNQTINTVESSKNIPCKFLKNLLNLIMTDPSRIRKLEFLRHTINAMNYRINQSAYKPVQSYITDITKLSAELNTTSAQDSRDNASHTQLSKEFYYKSDFNAANIAVKMQKILKCENNQKLTTCSEAYWLWRGSNDRAMRDLISKIPLSTSNKAPGASRAGGMPPPTASASSSPAPAAAAGARAGATAAGARAGATASPAAAPGAASAGATPPQKSAAAASASPAAAGAASAAASGTGAAAAGASAGAPASTAASSAAARAGGTPPARSGATQQEYKDTLDSIPEGGSSTGSPRSSGSTEPESAELASQQQAGESEIRYDLLPSMSNNMMNRRKSASNGPDTQQPPQSSASSLSAASPGVSPAAPGAAAASPASAGASVAPGAAESADDKISLTALDEANAINRLNNSGLLLSEINTESLLNYMVSLNSDNLGKIDINRLACIIAHICKYYATHTDANDQKIINEIKGMIEKILGLYSNNKTIQNYIISTVAVEICTHSTKSATTSDYIANAINDTYLKRAFYDASEIYKAMRKNEEINQTHGDKVQYIMLDTQIDYSAFQSIIEKMTEDNIMELNSESLFRLLSLVQADISIADKINNKKYGAIITNLCMYYTKINLMGHDSIKQEQIQGIISKITRTPSLGTQRYEECKAILSGKLDTQAIANLEMFCGKGHASYAKSEAAYRAQA